MLPYFLLLFVIAFLPLMFYPTGVKTLNYNYNVIVEKRSKITISIFFVGLFILLALRDITVGTDLGIYKSIYEICYKTPFKYLSYLQWEIGYTIYNKLVAFILNEYRFFLIVTAFITIWPIYKLYSKEKKFSYLLIVLFINMPCFLMLFSGLRQAIAISIGVLAYIVIEEKKHMLGILLILLAMLFHTSAFVLFLIYPALYLKIRTKHLLYIVPMILIIYVYRNSILPFIITYMPSKYIESYSEIEQTGAVGMMILLFLFLAFSFIILDESAMNNKDYCMRNLLIIATIIQLFVPIHGLIQRASYYFLIFVPVSIVSIVSKPKEGVKSISNIAVVVMSMFFTLYFFYNAYYSTDNLLDVFPYKFFWNNQNW